MSRHFNQLVDAAAGTYFVLLCDDDLIGPGFISAMVGCLESDPEIGVAIPNVELMNEAGGSVLLDKRSVLLSANVVDITGLAVARIDRSIGDGPDQLNLPETGDTPTSNTGDDGATTATDGQND